MQYLLQKFIIVAFFIFALPEQAIAGDIIKIPPGQKPILVAPDCDLPCIQQIVQSRKIRERTEVLEAARTQLQQDQKEGEARYSAILSHYQNNLKDKDTAVLQTRLGIAVTKQVGGAAFDLIPSPAGKFVGSLANITMDISGQYLEDEIKKRYEADGRLLLVDVLRKIKNEDQALFEQMKTMSPDARSAAILARRKDLVGDAFWSQIEPEHQGELLRHAVTMHSEVLMREIKNNSDWKGVQKVEIAAAKTRLAAVEKGLKVFKDETRKDLKKIQDGQNALRDGIELVKDNIALNSNDIDLLQEVMFGKMSPREQAKALSDGFFRRLSGEKRKELVAKTKLAAERQEIDEKITSGFRAAGAVVQIATALKVDPKLIQNANAGIKAASGIYGIAKAWGSPLAMLEATGAFADTFGSGSDAAGARHEQIMEQLGLIRKEIADLRQELEAFRRDVKKEFEELRKDLESKHRELIKNQLSTIQQAVDTRLIAVEGLMSEIRQCRDFERIWSEVLHLKYRDEDRISEFNNTTAKSLFGQCTLGMRSRLIFRADEIATTWSGFYVSSHLINQTGERHAAPGELSLDDFEFFKTNLFLPASAWHRQSSLLKSDSGALDEASLALMAAGSDSIRSLNLALSKPKAERRFSAEESKDRLGINNVSPVLVRPIAAELLNSYAPAFRLVLSLYNRIKDPEVAANAQMLSLDEVIGRKSYVSNEAVYMAQNLILLYDVAIAQENMLAGIFSVPTLVSVVDDRLSKDTASPVAEIAENNYCQHPDDKYATAICLLKKNPLLARNFAISWVMRRLEKQKREHKDYQVAANVTDSEYFLTWALGNAPYHFNGSAWTIRLPSVSNGFIEIPLPNHGDIRRGRFWRRPIVEELIQQRMLTANLLGELLFNDGATEKLRQRIFATLIIQASMTKTH